jgi:hypothetical protein
MHDTGRDTSSAPDDDLSDGTWMTYADLAKLREINQASAFKLALRHRWRRQKTNTGQMTVFVPSAWSDTSQDNAHDVSRQNEAFQAALAAVREVHAREISALREMAETAERRADQAEADRRAAVALADQTVLLLTDAVSRADQAEQGREAARKRAHELANRMFVVQGAADRAEAEAGDLRRQVEAAQIAQAEAEADAAELRQAATARRGRGRLARLRAAWRGE